MAVAKPAIASTTVWGGIVALAGGILPFLPQVVQFVPVQWQPVVSGIVAAVGGVMAIYGRSNPNIAPIQGIIRAP